MKESDYGIKEAEWKLLDPGNPAFRPVGFRDWGRNMQASYRILPSEDAKAYWDRVGADILSRQTRTAPPGRSRDDGASAAIPPKQR